VAAKAEEEERKKLNFRFNFFPFFVCQHFFFHSRTGLPDGLFSIQKFQFG
jgi:hypothetical protein